MSPPGPRRALRAAAVAVDPRHRGGGVRRPHAGHRGDPRRTHTAVFPIDGPHDLSRWQDNRFGGGRGHDGQDMFADCGTPVRAAQAGRVMFAGYQGAAGNYLVIRSHESGEDQVYMHLLNEPRLAEGDHVETGQRSPASAGPATPTAATCTSSCGPCPAGTGAATPTTRSESCASGTAGPRG